MWEFKRRPSKNYNYLFIIIITKQKLNHNSEGGWAADTVQSYDANEPN